MNVRRAILTAGSLLAIALLVRCLPVDHPVQSDWDVRGNYDLTWDDQLTLKLDLGTEVRVATASGFGQVVDLGTWNGQPLTLDLAAFCAKPEVVCPSETFWKKVSIDQQDVTTAQNFYGLQVVNNETHELPEGMKAQTLAGLVTNTDEDPFVVGLGASAGSTGSCGALGISFAAGRFTHENEERKDYIMFQTPNGAACDAYDAGTFIADPFDSGMGEVCLPYKKSRMEYPEGSKVDGIAKGRLFMGWLGGCAFGPYVAAATLTIETGFTGKRTGEFDPPPYTPAQPVDITPNDAGLSTRSDAGSSTDASHPPPKPVDAGSPEDVGAGEPPDVG
ncbi:MAG: hypothetical protein QM765_20335 [Myxococcales bacterium]